MIRYPKLSDISISHQATKLKVLNFHYCQSNLDQTEDTLSGRSFNFMTTSWCLTCLLLVLLLVLLTFLKFRIKERSYFVMLQCKDQNWLRNPFIDFKDPSIFCYGEKLLELRRQTILFCVWDEMKKQPGSRQRMMLRNDIIIAISTWMKLIVTGRKSSIDLVALH